MEKIAVFMEAKEEHRLDMLEIYNYYLENTTVTFDHGKITVDEFKNRVLIQHPRYKTFLIFVENELAGFSFLTQFRKKAAFDHTGELGLYLKPTYTGKGLGIKAVQYIEKVAIENQIDMLIASISSENNASIKLFQKLAYQPCAHYKEVAVKFNRKLDLIDFQKALN